MKQTSKIFLSLALMSSLTTGALASISMSLAPHVDSKNTFATGDKTFLLNGNPLLLRQQRFIIHVFRVSIGNIASRCVRL